MHSSELALIAYLIGTGVLIALVLKRRVAALFTWPFWIYGMGPAFTYFDGDNPAVSFAYSFVSPGAIIWSAYFMLIFVMSSAVLDFAILRSRSAPALLLHDGGFFGGFRG